LIMLCRVVCRLILRMSWRIFVHRVFGAIINGLSMIVLGVVMLMAGLSVGVSGRRFTLCSIGRIQNNEGTPTTSPFHNTSTRSMPVAVMWV